MFGTGEMLLLVAVLLALVFSGVHIAVALGAASMLGIYLMTGDFQVVASFVGSTAYEAVPWAVRASCTSHPRPNHAIGTRDESATVGTSPSAGATSRTSRSRTKVSRWAATRPSWPSPRQPPPTRG